MEGKYFLVKQSDTVGITTDKFFKVKNHSNNMLVVDIVNLHWNEETGELCSVGFVTDMTVSIDYITYEYEGVQTSEEVDSESFNNAKKLCATFLGA